MIQDESLPALREVLTFHPPKDTRYRAEKMCGIRTGNA